MKEINSLIERAKKYLKSTKILLEERDYESSVSRTYYAMFYSVQAILLIRRKVCREDNSISKGKKDTMVMMVL